MDLAATSTEYVHITVTATINGSPVTPTDVKMALLATRSNPEPADWYDAEWTGTLIRLLVGPEGGALTLERGTYTAWVTFTAGLETPVRRAPVPVKVY